MVDPVINDPDLGEGAFEGCSYDLASVCEVYVRNGGESVVLVGSEC